MRRRQVSRRVMAALAYGIVAVPFGVALVRLLAASQAHVYLPDDLALVDLHTRLALEWKQSLGPFDRYGWSHPGPAWFYVLSVLYRVIGGGPRTLYAGAALVNGLCACGVVWVVHRRAGPARALWAAVWVAVLAVAVGGTGGGSQTFSEGGLGALVSPWNPLVVIFPLLLFVVLCAAGPAGSPLSLVGALVVGSFCVQTDLSTFPLVAAALVLAVGATVVRWWVGVRRGRVAVAGGGGGLGLPGGLPGGVRGGAPAGGGAGAGAPGRGRWRWWLGGAGAATVVLMWIPPLVQQLTTTPGNLTLIVRFFTGHDPQAQGHQPLHAALWSVAAVDAVLVAGASEVMNVILGSSPAHPVLAVLALVATLVVGAAGLALGIRRRHAFGTGLGAFGLVGTVVGVVAATRVTGFVFGYLVAWEVVVPVAALVGLGVAWPGWPASRVGTERAATGATATEGTATGATATGAMATGATAGRVPSHRWPAGGVERRRRAGRLALGVVALAVGIAFVVRAATIPPLSAASSPAVGRIVALSAPRIARGRTVFVGDQGLGILETEEFIGVVNRLDALGYRPLVSSFWEVQFGPIFSVPPQATPHQDLELSYWTRRSPKMAGYVGRAGDVAVVFRRAPPVP